MDFRRAPLSRVHPECAPDSVRRPSAYILRLSPSQDGPCHRLSKPLTGIGGERPLQVQWQSAVPCLVHLGQGPYKLTRGVSLPSLELLFCFLSIVPGAKAETSNRIPHSFTSSSLQLLRSASSRPVRWRQSAPTLSRGSTHSRLRALRTAQHISSHCPLDSAGQGAREWQHLLQTIHPFPHLSFPGDIAAEV